MAQRADAAKGYLWKRVGFDMNSIISIILPAYRAQGFLPYIIGDICAQTYPHWELICVSNGKEQEGQLAILNDWKRKDERIKVICTPPEHGGGDKLCTKQRVGCGDR